MSQIQRVFDLGFTTSMSTRELSGTFPSPRVNERHLVSQLGHNAPAHSISGPLPLSTRSESCTPGPNAFRPNSNVLRPSSARYSFAHKYPSRKGAETPGPNVYLYREPYSHMKLPCTMKLKKYKKENAENQNPGPADYTPRTSQTLTRAPSMPMTMAKRGHFGSTSSSSTSSTDRTSSKRKKKRGAGGTPGPQSYNSQKDFCLKSSRKSTIVGKPRRHENSAGVPGANAYFGDMVPRSSRGYHARSQPVLGRQKIRQQLTSKPLRPTPSYTIGRRRETKPREEHCAPLCNLQRQWGIIHFGRNQTPHTHVFSDTTKSFRAKKSHRSGKSKASKISKRSSSKENDSSAANAQSGKADIQQSKDADNGKDRDSKARRGTKTKRTRPKSAMPRFA